MSVSYTSGPNPTNRVFELVNSNGSRLHVPLTLNDFSFAYSDDDLTAAVQAFVSSLNASESSALPLVLTRFTDTLLADFHIADDPTS